MHKNIVKARRGLGIGGKRVFATIALACVTVVAAFATDPPPENDYTSSLTAFKGDMQGFLSTNGPALLGALVVLLAFGIVWKLVKRAAKSI